MSAYSSASDPLRLPFFFFFNAPATTEIYTLSLHDALPISGATGDIQQATQLARAMVCQWGMSDKLGMVDRKSTRLNSSHLGISYAVFCLKKKNTKERGP